MATNRSNKISGIAGAAVGTLLTLFAATTEPALAGVLQGFQVNGRTPQGTLDYASVQSIKAQSILVLSKNEKILTAVTTGAEAIAKLTPYNIIIVKNEELPLGASDGKVLFFANSVDIKGTLIDIKDFDGSVGAMTKIANKVAETLVSNHRKYMTPTVVSSVLNPN